jgi:hypothetical protein
VDVADDQDGQIVRSHASMLIARRKWGFRRRVEFISAEGA